MSGPAPWLIGAVGGGLALDETAFAQTWLSQPLPAGWLAGVAAGDPVLGLVLGAAVQLLVVGDLPIGETTLRDHVAPLVGAVFAAVTLDWRLEFPWRDPLAASRLGWLLVGVAAASLLGRRVLLAERQLHGRWQLAALRALRAGRDVPVTRYQVAGLLVTAGRGAVAALVWFLVFRRAWLPVWGRGGETLHAAAALLAWWSPAVAAGALLDLYGTRAGRPFLAAGVLVAAATWWWWR